MLIDAPQVAILVDTATGWGRRLIRGITSYARNHGRWHLHAEPRGQTEHLRVPPAWHGDGIIARISTQAMADELRSLRVPVVNVSGIELPNCDFPRVSTNYGATARLAAEHFMERGYRQFAYVGPLSHSYVRRHANAFAGVLAEQGLTCQTFDYRHEPRGGRDLGPRGLPTWLQKLPKPVGVFSWATSAGAQVLDLCRYLSIAVPDDLAMLAGDDDPLLCDLTSPPMSAILVASEQIGFHAAARLERLMQKQRDTADELLDPISITTRGSTETFAIDDAELRRAMIFLRQHAFRPIGIAEIADAVPMSRRSLERRFQAVLGRTPLDEIRRLRLSRVRELLAMSDRSIDDIARATGFGTPEYMTAVFRASQGTTPLKYRRQVRSGE